MRRQEQTLSQPLYRLEEARFTARKIDNMDEDDDISLGAPYRSFTKGDMSTVSLLASELDESGADITDYVLIRTVGRTSAFDMSPYTKNYNIDQKEVLVGGDFEFLGEGTATVNGVRLRRIDIRQL